MSRRRRGTDPGFGSDSFLDIIANIVGILIILIVVAGVRVSQAPVEPPENSPAEPTASTSKSGNETDTQEHQTSVRVLPILENYAHRVRTGATTGGASSLRRQLIVEPPPRLTPGRAATSPAWLTTAILRESDVPPTPEPIDPRPPAVAEPKPQPVFQVSVELRTQIEQLQQELQRYPEQLNRLQREIDELTRQEQAARQQLARNQQTLEQKDFARAQQRRRMADLRREYQRVETEFVTRQRDLARLEQTAPPAKIIRHELNPVGRLVDGPEVHFHLKDGRIAYVPLDELIERMKTQVIRQKNWVLKTGRLRGEVGPQDGFTLDFLVARQRMNAFEGARLGGSVARVQPVLLKFRPDRNPLGETVNEALNPRSLFIRQLRLAPRNATLTFWVYPDSFGLYRQLKDFAHEEGFSVAARPLQSGDVITASPHGSRSVGQ